MKSILDSNKKKRLDLSLCFIFAQKNSLKKRNMTVAYLIFGLYTLALTFIFLYSLVAFYLSVVYLVSQSKVKKQGSLSIVLEQNYPKVTVQLPVYNELYVIERLIDSVCQFDYPSDKLEIQVLDDSTDETVLVIANKIAEWQTKGVDIQYVRRVDRKGFKAGALANGLKFCKGELIAIFDADFVPSASFLKETTFYFMKDKKMGVVQTRWGHLNANYSLLTRLQAFALNAHFRVEQVGRNKAHHFINFNGTAGIWRKSCVEDAGGWSADTLTEDLDLSYRAQLKGWKFKYLERIVVAAELPVSIEGLKNQQFRWSKGGAECSRKNLGKVLRSKDISLGTKITAVFHLLNSSLFIAVLLLILLSVPLLYEIEINRRLSNLYNYLGFFFINTFLLGVMYFVATRKETNNIVLELVKFLLFFPVFLTAMLGLTTYNAKAVLEGLIGVKSSFVRTPKYNLTNKSLENVKRKYKNSTFSYWIVLDFIIIIYSMYGVGLALKLEQYGMGLFLIMVVVGFSYTFTLSLLSFFKK